MHIYFLSLDPLMQTHFLLQELLSREEALIPEPEIRKKIAYALQLAIRSGQVEYVLEFANTVLLCTLIAAYDDYCFLHEAAVTGSVDIYKLLVDNGANEKVRDKEDRMIMHVVAEHNHERLGLAVASQEGAELAAQDNKGWTPLHQAVFSESYEVSQLLLERGT